MGFAAESNIDVQSNPVPGWRPFCISLLFVAVISKLLFPEPIVLPMWHTDAWRLAIVAEASLLAMLLAFPKWYVTRLATGTLFIVFAAYSLWALYSGAKTCACFGAISHLPLWCMAILDFFVLVALFNSQICISLTQDRVDQCSRLARRLIVGSFIVVGLGGFAFGAPHNFADRMLGRLLTTQPYMIVGDVASSGDVTVNFELKNITDRPIVILGAQSSCGSKVVSELPVSISPQQSKSLTVCLKPAGISKPSLLNAQVRLLLDRRSFPVNLKISAFVRFP